ncbi:MAG: aminoglycoside phosphotransferase family protein [Candidatus Nanohaloarchaea archaeon]
MKKQQILDWLSEREQELGLDSPEIIRKKEGESNHNFILESEEEKYVLRASKQSSRKDRLRNESKALQLLEEKGIANVPRLKLYEKEREVGSVLVQSFVGRRDVERAGSLNLTQLRNLAMLLGDIHSIDFGDSNEYFEGSKKESLQQLYGRDFERWSERPYREYLDNVEEPDERIQKFYRKQQELLEEVPDREVETSFIHSDLGFNIRTYGEKVFVVDWEYSEIGFHGHDLMILFEHGKLDQEQRQIFLDEYRKKKDLGEAFEEVREIHPKFLAFHDAVWAARRNAQGENRHLLIERKIKKLEKLYGED